MQFYFAVLQFFSDAEKRGPINVERKSPSLFRSLVPTLTFLKCCLLLQIANREPGTYRMSVPVAKLIEQSVEGWLGSRKEEASSALELVALSDSQVFFWLTKLNSQFVFQRIHWDYRAHYLLGFQES